MENSRCLFLRCKQPSRRAWYLNIRTKHRKMYYSKRTCLFVCLFFEREREREQRRLFKLVQTWLGLQEWERRPGERHGAARIRVPMGGKGFDWFVTNASPKEGGTWAFLSGYVHMGQNGKREGWGLQHVSSQTSNKEARLFITKIIHALILRMIFPSVILAWTNLYYKQIKMLIFRSS